MEFWGLVEKSPWIYVCLWPSFTSPWPVNFEMFSSFSDSIATQFKLRQRNMFTEWHIETRLADSLELPMTLTTSCLRVMLWMVRCRSKIEICPFSTSTRVYKAQIRLRVLTFIQFSSSPSSIACWFKLPKVRVAFWRWPFSYTHPEDNSIISTPNPFLLRTRGPPRRDHNAQHNGLVSSPSEQYE